MNVAIYDFNCWMLNTWAWDPNFACLYPLNVRIFASLCRIVQIPSTAPDIKGLIYSAAKPPLLMIWTPPSSYQTGGWRSRHFRSRHQVLDQLWPAGCSAASTQRSPWKGRAKVRTLIKPYYMLVPYQPSFPHPGLWQLACCCLTLSAFWLRPLISLDTTTRSTRASKRGRTMQ